MTEVVDRQSPGVVAWEMAKPLGSYKTEGLPCGDERDVCACGQQS